MEILDTRYPPCGVLYAQRLWTRRNMPSNQVYKTIEEASDILATPPAVLRRLVRVGMVPHKEENGITVIHVPEAAVALGIDINVEGDLELEQAQLALIQRRIARLDIQTQRDRLAYKEKIGQLLPIEEVEQGRVERVRAVRSALLGMSRALPVKLVGKDLKEITVILEQEARRILETFAGKEQPDDPI